MPTAGGEVRIVAPAPTLVWEPPPGFAPVGAAAAGTGAALELPLPARTADTMVLVQARKTHAAGAESFQSSERLEQPAVVLVRPDPRPALRLEAMVADGKLVRLAALEGQRGVFYALTAGNALAGRLYLHQTDEAERRAQQGIGVLRGRGRHGGGGRQGGGIHLGCATAATLARRGIAGAPRSRVSIVRGAPCPD